MWADLLYTWLDSNPGDPPEEIERRLRQQLEVLWRDEVFGVHYAYLASFLALPLEAPFADEVAQLDGETWRRIQTKLLSFLSRAR